MYDVQVQAQVVSIDIILNILKSFFEGFISKMCRISKCRNIMAGHSPNVSEPKFFFEFCFHVIIMFMNSLKI